MRNIGSDNGEISRQHHDCVDHSNGPIRRGVSARWLARWGARSIAGAVAIATAAAACHPGDSTSPLLDNVGIFRVGSDSSGLVGAVPNPTALHFGTYEGSGQVVHPDVVTFPENWNGHRFWTVLTPYPNSASQYENPSVYASDDGANWTTPAGVTNPLAGTKRGYLSDPDMVFDSVHNELRLYYREVWNANPGTKTEKHLADNIWMTTSSNSTQWSTPRLVAADSNKFVVSPAIVHTPDDSWRMYGVDASAGGCAAKSTHVVLRRSIDGIAWSNSLPNGLSQPGYQPWHIDVQYVPERGEYWALVAAYPNGQSCMVTSLFLATSTDGLQWSTYPAPILARGEFAPFSNAVYRSTFAFAPDSSVTLWMSGARVVVPATKAKPAVIAWSAAVTHTTAEALLARVVNRINSPALPVKEVSGSTMLAPATSVP